MRVVIQRVSFAKLRVEGKIVGEIGRGYFILLGIHKDDDESKIEKVVNKIMKLKLFDNPEKKGYFVDDISEADGGILVASQFTLYANTDKGTKPSFTDSMNPADAKKLYNRFMERLKIVHPNTYEGIFAAYMKIEMENDGPATFIIDF